MFLIFYSKNNKYYLHIFVFLSYMYFLFLLENVCCVRPRIAMLSIYMFSITRRLKEKKLEFFFFVFFFFFLLNYKAIFIGSKVE